MLENIKNHAVYLAKQYGMMVGVGDESVTILAQDEIMTISTKSMPSRPLEVWNPQIEEMAKVDAMSPIHVRDGQIRCQVSRSGERDSWRYWAIYNYEVGRWVSNFLLDDIIEDQKPYPHTQAWHPRMRDWLSIKFSQDSIWLEDEGFYAFATITGVDIPTLLFWNPFEKCWVCEE